jgi:hypothetical protein
MLRVNFFGGPGVGKSVLAAKVYAELSRGGIVSTELVQEFIKSWAYAERQIDKFDQVYTFANQLWSEHRLLKSGVQVVVTDSPILLQCVYTSQLDQCIATDLMGIAQEYEKAYPSLNFFVARDVPYKPFGRYQTAAEVELLDRQILGFIENMRLNFITVVPREWDTILATVKEAAYAMGDVKWR